MPAPSVSPTVTQYAGPVTEMLANDENLVLLPGQMARYDENDWCNEAAVNYTGLFPAGALLGWKPTGGAPAWAHALDADRTDDGVPELSTDRDLYTWTSNAIVTRGSGLVPPAGPSTIPATNDAMAVVLAEDADVTDYTAAAHGNLLVSVIWSGNFKPRGILQDADSYALGAWPVVIGGCDRLAIVPAYGDMVG